MKKINIYIFSFLLLISSISFSDFNINFFSSYGFYNQDGLSPLLPNVGDGALVQLVYAGENDQIDEITDYELSTGDDVVISSFEVINDGSEFSEYAFGTYGTVTSPYLGNGYVYGRVFSDLLPIVGTSYYVGSLFQAIDMDLDVVPPFVPESYNLGGDNGGIASSVLNFETNVVSTIYLTITNSIGGLVNNEGTTVFYEPTTISVEATADLGYLFSTWNDEQGNSQSSENPYNFDLNKDQILIATFEPDLSDSDQDGLTLYDEVIVYGSDPNQPDTSGDGLLDGTLVLMGLEPTINFSNLVNTVQAIPESFGVFGAAYVQNQENAISTLNELVNSQNQDLANLESINAGLVGEIIELGNQNDNLNVQVNTLSEENNNLNTSISALSEEVLSLEVQVSSLSDSNQQLSSSNASLSEQNNLLTQEVSALESSNDSLVSSNNQLQESLNGLTAQNNSLLEQINSIQAANILLEEQLSILSSTNGNGSLAEQIAVLQSTNLFLTSVVSELINENLGLEETNENIIAQLQISFSNNEELENQIVDLQYEIADLEDALEDSYVDYEYPWWKPHNHWWYTWHKPNNYWWGWGNPPARNLPKWGRDATIGKRLKMKRIKNRRNRGGNDVAQMDVEFCVEQTSDLVSGEWTSTTNNVSLDIPVDDNSVKFYRIIYN